MKSLITYINESIGKNEAEKMVKEITQKFKDECKDIHGRPYCPYDITWSYDDESIVIFVEEGDWKHDHRFVDNFMEKLGYKKVDEDIYGDSDDDSYSSTHYFQKIQK